MSNFHSGPRSNGPHRMSSATGSAGPVGASFAVVEKNWTCSSCRAENLARRQTCFRCRERKPRGGGGIVWHEGAVAFASGEDLGWREAIDPETKQLYYYNLTSKETRWDRPKEMGQSLTATGWYGRGKAGSMKQVELENMNKEYLKRPAIKQVDETEARDVSYFQGTENFNIYYGKYNGEQWNRRALEPAKTRCSVGLHSGYTLADKRARSKSAAPSYFCLMWCKGSCYKGHKCNFFHRVPVYSDIGHLEKDMLHDCFGRERHATHRDDMQGAGSFNDPCRTLYVGKLQRSHYSDDSKALEKVLDKHFGEFGEVEHINVIWSKAIAFVRFRFRSHAEMAKEAMASQTLDHDEILDLRWAYEDPNPVAKESIRRANADAVVAAISAASKTSLQTSFQLPLGYKPENETKDSLTKTASLENAHEAEKLGSEYHYPNTDSQYPQTPKATAKQTNSSTLDSPDRPSKRIKPSQLA